MKQIKPFASVSECLDFLTSLGIKENEQIRQSLASDLHYCVGEYIVVLDTNNLIQK